MIDLPIALIGACLLAAGLVLVLSRRLDPDNVQVGDRHRARIAETPDDDPRGADGGGRDA